MTSQECSCQFCGKHFKATRYLQNHIETGKECRKLRGVLFICMRCSCFHTTKLGLLQSHLEKCKVDGRVVDLIEDYQTQISRLNSKINILEERLSRKENAIEDEIEIVPTTIENVLDATFGKITIGFEFVIKYSEVAIAKKYNIILRAIKRERRILFKKGDLDEYKTHLKTHLELLKQNLEKREHENKKQRKIILSHFTAIDLRMLRFSGYEKLSPDGFFTPRT